MRLTVAGGAAAWPNPGQGCSCYLVQSQATSIVIDCGPNTLQELRRHVDYRRVSAIVISHCHSDHMLDLVPYRYGLKYGPGGGSERIPVWLPEGGIQRLAALATALSNQDESVDDFWSSVFDLREYDVSDALVIDDVRFAFKRTQHFVPCYAMRMTDDIGKSIAYSADTGDTASLESLFMTADLGIIEATLPSDTHTPPAKRGHLTPEEAGTLAHNARVSTLVLTHLWSERPSADVVSAAASAYSGAILPATPGLVVHV
jgi:ribonuclease BN (tRNA processing enzyme)